MPPGCPGDKQVLPRYESIPDERAGQRTNRNDGIACTKFQDAYHLPAGEMPGLLFMASSFQVDLMYQGIKPTQHDKNNINLCKCGGAGKVPIWRERLQRNWLAVCEAAGSMADRPRLVW